MQYTSLNAMSLKCREYILDILWWMDGPYDARHRVVAQMCLIVKTIQQKTTIYSDQQDFKGGELVLWSENLFLSACIDSFSRKIIDLYCRQFICNVLFVSLTNFLSGCYIFTSKHELCQLLYGRANAVFCYENHKQNLQQRCWTWQLLACSVTSWTWRPLHPASWRGCLWMT